MEERENSTTVGFLFWTPAQIRASHTSSAASEDETEDEKEDDFHRQMDENGIIGLTEAVDNVGIEETYDDVMFQTEEDVKQTMEEQDKDLLTTVERYCNITEDSESEEEQWERSNCREKKCEVISSTLFPHLRHFTAEELAEAPGILSESSLVLDCTESFTGSSSSQISDLSSTVKRDKRSPGSSPGPEPQDTFSEELLVGTRNTCHEQDSPCQSRMKQGSLKAKHSQTQSLGNVRTESSKSTCQTASLQSPPSLCKARAKTLAMDESRKQSLNYCTPDYSQVEPRVRLPKNIYTPPKSRFCWRKRSNPPLALNCTDSVTEEALSDADGPQTPADSGPTVSNELILRQDEDTLLLQENYNALLIKHAEAENIIDQLRLEAKVNLHSNPPVPNFSVQLALTQQGSKVMTLDFPQSQRADVNCSSSLHSNGHGNSPSYPPSSASIHSRCLDEHMGQNLCKQITTFVLQLQDFDNLIQSGKLKASEQLECLTQLEQKLDSLKNKYLSTRNEHRYFQQRGGQISQFDPNRELESLLVQYQVHLDELKDPLGQITQDHPTCAVSSSPPPVLSPVSVSTSVGELLPHPQVLSKPWLPLDSVAIAHVDMRSANKECDQEVEGTEDEETVSSSYLNTLKDEQSQDFNMELDERYQSYQELPKVLSFGQGEHLLRNKVQQGVEVKGSGTRKVRKSFPQRSDHQDSVSKESRPPSRQVSSHSTIRSAYRPAGSRKFKTRMPQSSSLSSLEDSGPSERRKQLKHQSGKVFSQDEIGSPEMDSGFVGSESSRLACATGCSPLHQTTPMSVLVHQEMNTVMHQIDSVSALPPPASLSSLRKTSLELSGSDKLRTTQHPDKRSTSECCVTKPHISQTKSRRPANQTTSSEWEQNDHLCGSSSSLSTYSSSPSPDSSCHHDESLSKQKANYGVILQDLQAEVSRLKRRLESSLRKSVRAAASDQGNTFTPCTGTEEMMSDMSRARRVRHVAEESTLRPAAGNRSASICRHKHQPPIYSDSLPCTTRPHISRCTQTSAASHSDFSDRSTVHSRRRLPNSEYLPCTTWPRISRWTQTCAAPHSNLSDANTVQSRRKLNSKKTRPRARHAGPSEQVCKAADEPDSKDRAAVCSECSFTQSKWPAGGDKELTLFSCTCHCPVCGSTKTNTNCQPAVRSAPVLLHCVPAYTSPYLFYCGHMRDSHPQPPVVSPSANKGTLFEFGGQMMPSSSMSTSLDRAIRAARRMKSSSSHMVRYLASGLRYRELLFQPQIY
ncbi:microtubule organization protein AKNA isoform X1 [Thalassophryne amazonica]|uniref:microtubule organization protein AKNA isoform X1 n=1 Tax=Thalassophryne amazonica TaxID=390379 RepID=UPI001471DA5A|nr:microtubule organization protein AKNA isoform X1 [Thalassophryne amazonica]